MKIKKFDKYGISLEGENRWLSYGNPKVGKLFGPLYTWDELDKQVKKRLIKQKTVKLKDYVFLLKKLEEIKIKLNSISLDLFPKENRPSKVEPNPLNDKELLKNLEDLK